MSEFAHLLHAIDRVDSIVAGVASWEVKFDAVFGIYQSTIRPLLVSTGVTFDWCDPDMGYEDDVRAFASALCGDFRRDVSALVDADMDAALRTAVEACERLVVVAEEAGDEHLAIMARPAAGVLRRQMEKREEGK